MAAVAVQMLDLIVVVPDLDIENAITTLLNTRTQALGIRPVKFDVYREHGRDPGVFHRCREALTPWTSGAEFALVMLDTAWESCPFDQDPEQVENAVEADLSEFWEGRARCVALHPEVESWIWSPSPHVAETLGYEGSTLELRSDLEAMGLWPSALSKPPDPKLAYEHAMRIAGLPKSASHFRDLAAVVSIAGCEDRAMLRLREWLQEWFPAEQAWG